MTGRTAGAEPGLESRFCVGSVLSPLSLLGEDFFGPKEGLRQMGCSDQKASLQVPNFSPWEEEAQQEHSTRRLQALRELPKVTAAGPTLSAAQPPPLLLPFTHNLSFTHAALLAAPFLPTSAGKQMPGGRGALSVSQPLGEGKTVPNRGPSWKAGSVLSPSLFQHEARRVRVKLYRVRGGRGSSGIHSESQRCQNKLLHRKRLCEDPKGNQKDGKKVLNIF